MTSRNSIQKFKKRFQQLGKKKHSADFIQNYIEENHLSSLIEEADRLSKSTGADHGDYVMLHSYIRNKKIKHILEAGTGKSTWIIADALKKNFEENLTEGSGLVVSMEENQDWYQHAISIFPEELRQYVQICYSPISTFSYSFVIGTCYETVPSYPYQLVYVDGPNTYLEHLDPVPHAPDCGDDRGDVVANMDFIKVVSESEIPVTAMIDYRTRTQMAYSCIFGKEKVKFLQSWSGLGIVENVTKNDLILNGASKLHRQRLREMVTTEAGDPAWF